MLKKLNKKDDVIMKLSNILQAKNVDSFSIDSEKENQYTLLKDLRSKIDNKKLTKYFLKLLENKTFDPSWQQNYFFNTCCEFDRHDLVEIMLKDPRIDPTFQSNRAIKLAYYTNSYKTIELLMNDKRVYKKLEKDKIETLKAFINR